jgi:hypothetical protein
MQPSTPRSRRRVATPRALVPAGSAGSREWITGARPVVGTFAACSLLLLACSWFVVDGGSFGSHADVGTPNPVHLQGSAPARDVSTRRAGASAAPRSTRAGASAKHGAAVTPARHLGTGAPPVRRNGPAGSEQGPGRATPQPAQPSADSTAASSPPPPPVTVPPLPPVPPVPPISLPPIPPVPPLPPVSLPQVPDVPTVTTVIGSP